MAGQVSQHSCCFLRSGVVPVERARQTFEEITNAVLAHDSLLGKSGADFASDENPDRNLLNSLPTLCQAQEAEDGIGGYAGEKTMAPVPKIQSCLCS
jgi:hypothetical protein